MKRKINPILAGLCNIIFPGSAYVLMGKREVFGWLLLVNVILTYVWAVVYPGTVTPGMWGPLEFQSTLGIVALLFLAAAFGYDAYTLAKEK